jgi:hypothetical protein
MMVTSPHITRCERMNIVTTIETSTRIIHTIERLNNSMNGNPRYCIGFADGSEAVTSSDASFCYAIGNPGMRAGCTVTMIFTRAGRISHMEAAAKPYQEAIADLTL